MEQLAETFGIRVQRAMAIVALKEREHAAAEAGQPLDVELAGGAAAATAVPCCPKTAALLAGGCGSLAYACRVPVEVPGVN